MSGSVADGEEGEAGWGGGTLTIMADNRAGSDESETDLRKVGGEGEWWRMAWQVGGIGAWGERGGVRWSRPRRDKRRGAVEGGPGAGGGNDADREEVRVGGVRGGQGERGGGGGWRGRGGGERRIACRTEGAVEHGGA